MDQALAKRRSSSTFPRALKNEENQKVISNITRFHKEALAHSINESTKISLDDVAGVQEVTLRYMEACERVGMLPTMSGLASAIGTYREMMYSFIRHNPDHPTAKFLSQVSDTFGEIMMQSAASTAIQPIVSIFLAKARYGFREEDGINLASGNGAGSGGEFVSAEKIAEKYNNLPD